MGYDYRKFEPVMISDVGKVLAIYDLTAGKIRAFWDRAAARDYIDIYAFLKTGTLNSESLIDVLHYVRPEASLETFATMLRQAPQYQEMYKGYGFDAREISLLIQVLEKTATEIFPSE